MDLMGHIRVKYKWRVTGLAAPPATIPCFPTSTAVSKDEPIALTNADVAWIEENNSEHGARMVLSEASGWVNKLGFAEPIVFGGSVHPVLGYANGRYLIQKGSKMQFTCVNIFGVPRLPSNSLIAFVKAMAKRDMWINEKDCVFSTSPLEVIVPGSPPAPVPIVQVTLPPGSKLHQRPNGPVVLTVSGPVAIIGYGPKSWAQVADKRWVDLSNPRG